MLWVRTFYLNSLTHTKATGCPVNFRLYPPRVSNPSGTPTAAMTEDKSSPCPSGCRGRPEHSSTAPKFRPAWWEPDPAELLNHAPTPLLWGTWDLCHSLTQSLVTPSLLQRAPDVPPGLAVFRHHGRGLPGQCPSHPQPRAGQPGPSPGTFLGTEEPQLGCGPRAGERPWCCSAGAGAGGLRGWHGALWSLGGWGTPGQLGRASPSQVSPQGVAGRCHPGAREPLPFWTSSWEPEGWSKNLKRPLNWLCQPHWLQQQSLEFRHIDFKLTAMLLNGLSIICPQPPVLTLELTQTCSQNHCKMVVWVLNQFFNFLLLRKFPSSWGKFPSSGAFFLY